MTEHTLIPNDDFGTLKNAHVNVVHAISRHESFDFDELYALVRVPNWTAGGKSYYYLVSLADEDGGAIGHYWGLLDPSDLDLTVRQWIADDYFNVNPLTFKEPNAFASRRGDDWELLCDTLELNWM